VTQHTQPNGYQIFDRQTHDSQMVIECFGEPTNPLGIGNWETWVCLLPTTWLWLQEE